MAPTVSNEERSWTTPVHKGEVTGLAQGNTYFAQNPARSTAGHQQRNTCPEPELTAVLTSIRWKTQTHTEIGQNRPHH